MILDLKKSKRVFSAEHCSVALETRVYERGLTTKMIAQSLVKTALAAKCSANMNDALASIQQEINSVCERRS
jgi:hypothetical protein